VDVEPSGLTTVGLPEPEGRGGPVHAAENEAVLDEATLDEATLDEAALPLPVPLPPVPVPVPVPPFEPVGAEEEEDAATVAGETRTASAIVSATGLVFCTPGFSLR
jgi:hypothetical protein